MAASSTTGFPVTMSMPVADTVRAGINQRRRITPETGHAIRILGHAIEYLTDEFVRETGSFSADDERLEAVRLLMALNRQIYLECPEVPPFGRRFLSFFHLARN